MSDPTAPAPFDLDGAQKAIGDAVVNMVTLFLRAPGQQPDLEAGKKLAESLRNAVQAGSAACTEVTRMRTDLMGLRDQHRPQPHADPTKSGALCAACSVHGSIVSWPCATWSAAERILTYGKA
ncbi:hypothetical protein ACFVP3_23435 [Streptomyces sp. NPDC057806]|uniref:hypothetical protein n=1 Tax=Streptomyces sp. NPDC057806 TaxID=3346255 RepID=UPI0036C3BCC0